VFDFVFYLLVPSFLLRPANVKPMTPNPNTPMLTMATVRFLLKDASKALAKGLKNLGAIPRL
jgi:hypothetical protein